MSRDRDDIRNSMSRLTSKELLTPHAALIVVAPFPWSALNFDAFHYCQCQDSVLSTKLPSSSKRDRHKEGGQDKLIQGYRPLPHPNLIQWLLKLGGLYQTLVAWNCLFLDYHSRLAKKPPLRLKKLVSSLLFLRLLRIPHLTSYLFQLET